MRDEQVHRYARHIMLPDIGGARPDRAAGRQREAAAARERADRRDDRGVVSRGRRRRHARSSRTRPRRRRAQLAAHGPDTKVVDRAATRARSSSRRSPRGGPPPRRRRSRSRTGAAAIAATRMDGGRGLTRCCDPGRRCSPQIYAHARATFPARVLRLPRPAIARRSSRVHATSDAQRRRRLRDRRRRAARVRPQLRRPRAGARPLPLAHERPRLLLGDRPRRQAGGRLSGPAPRRRRDGRWHRRGAPLFDDGTSSSWRRWC